MTLTEDFEKQLVQKLAELQPAVDEYEEVTRLLAAIRGQAAPRRAAQAPRTRSGARTGGGKKQGRRTDRSAEALRRVTARPGITVAELASEMGIGPTYLYRVLPALEREGQVRKVGKGYEPAAPVK